MNVWDLLILFLLLGFPAIAYQIQNKSKFSWLSPVLLCYAAGIILANLKLFPINSELVSSTRDGSVLLGIPLLLFGTDLPAFLKQAKGMLLGFGLCVLSGVFITISLSFPFADFIGQIWVYGGMLVGVYTGGTPNMNLVGLALEAPEEAFIYLNGADIAIGGLFLLFILSVGKQFYGLFLKEAKVKPASAESKLQAAGSWPGRIPSLRSFSLAILVTGAAAGLTLLITGALKQVALLLILLTTLSLILSLNPRIRSMRASYPIGEYLLLIFSMAIGLLADFSQFQTQALPILLFTGSVLFLAAAVHLLLCRIFRIDRDTAIITAIAAFYGPPFVPQVASSLKNPGLIFPGILCGLGGFAIGNYLGISIGSLLEYLIK